jgi:hypothetical protein
MCQRSQKEHFKKYLETSKNGKTTNQKLLDEAKAALIEKYTVINAYIEKKNPLNKQLYILRN